MYSMSKEEAARRGALLTEWSKGGTVEYFQYARSELGWRLVAENNPAWNWSMYNYRIRPALVERFMVRYNNGSIGTLAHPTNEAAEGPHQ